MSEPRRQRGLLDTSAVIAMSHADRSQLPAEMALSAITVAELVIGPHAMDLLVAATALALDIPLFTCNPADFEGLDHLIDIVPIDPQ